MSVSEVPSTNSNRRCSPVLGWSMSANPTNTRPGTCPVPCWCRSQRSRHALDQFAAEAPTYVICKTGARSYRACEFLVDQGLDGVNVEGGTKAWIISGRGTVAGDQPA